MISNNSYSFNFMIINKNIIKINNHEHFETLKFILKFKWGLGIGDWGLGIGDWGLGPIPNPQSPIPNPQSPIPIDNYIDLKILKIIILINIIYL